MSNTQEEKEASLSLENVHIMIWEVDKAHQDKKDLFKEDLHGLFFEMGHCCTSNDFFDSTLGAVVYITSKNFDIIVNRGCYFLDKSTVCIYYRYIMKFCTNQIKWSEKYTSTKNSGSEHIVLIWNFIK